MADGAEPSGLNSTVNSLALAASLRAASATDESGDFATIKVATLPAAARNRWRRGSAAPFARSVATPRLTTRPVSFTSPGDYSAEPPRKRGMAGEEFVGLLRDVFGHGKDIFHIGSLSLRYVG